MMTSSGMATTTWNGGICATCNAKFLGAHQCSPADIMRRIQELMSLLPGMNQGGVPGNPGTRAPIVPPARDTSGCPCRRENGGSGACGCVLGGPRVTC